MADMLSNQTKPNLIGSRDDFDSLTSNAIVHHFYQIL